MLHPFQWQCCWCGRTEWLKEVFRYFLQVTGVVDFGHERKITGLKLPRWAVLGNKICDSPDPRRTNPQFLEKRVSGSKNPSPFALTQAGKEFSVQNSPSPLCSLAERSFSSKTKGPQEEGAAGYCPKIFPPKGAALRPKRPVSGRGGQTPLRPPFVTPPICGSPTNGIGTLSTSRTQSLGRPYRSKGKGLALGMGLVGPIDKSSLLPEFGLRSRCSMEYIFHTFERPDPLWHRDSANFLSVAAVCSDVCPGRATQVRREVHQNSSTKRLEEYAQKDLRKLQREREGSSECGGQISFAGLRGAGNAS